MERDAIDFGTEKVSTLFKKLFFPTLLGMLGMSAMTAIDGIFIGHSVGSDGIAAVNIICPPLMLLTGLGLMTGTGCSVVASIHLSRGKTKAARLNVTQAFLFATAAAAVPVALLLGFTDEAARLLGSSEHLLPLVRDYSYFNLYRMGIRELEDPRFQPCRKKLTENDRIRMKGLMEEEEYREVLAYMDEHDVKLEQEIISYYEEREQRENRRY